jgi:hypothetical protein
MRERDLHTFLVNNNIVGGPLQENIISDLSIICHLGFIPGNYVSVHRPLPVPHFTNIIYGRDGMVVGFMTTCAISAYHHKS